MSTRARKDRKKAGIPFSRKPKVGTPLQERAYFNGDVMVPVRLMRTAKDILHPRSLKKRNRWLADRGLEPIQ